MNKQTEGRAACDHTKPGVCPGCGLDILIPALTKDPPCARVEVRRSRIQPASTVGDSVAFGPIESATKTRWRWTVNVPAAPLE